MKAILLEQGCVFVRYGKGDHEVWRSPHALRPFAVDGKIMSRHSANGVLKVDGKIMSRHSANGVLKDAGLTVKL